MSDYTQDHRTARITTTLGKDKLLLKAISGSERVSALFEYEVQLQSTDFEIDYAKIIGKEVTITIDNPLKEGGTRYIHGIVASFAQASTRADLASYTARIVPKLWLTTLTQDSRIFQKKTVKEILEAIIKTDAGISDYRDSVSGAGTTPREYCVQYRETDFAFISRLMEEEGIYYYFEHADGKHTLVLCDGPNAHSTVSGSEKVPFRNASRASENQAVHTWNARHALLAGQFVAADYNFTTPATVLRSTANISRDHSANDAEIFEFPARFATSAEGDALAKIRINAHQSRHITYTANTTAITLTAGSKFSLTDHPVSATNQEYLILENYLALENPSYTDTISDTNASSIARIIAIPFSQEFRPARITPRPDLRGPHTAVVVGAKDEEIHTDKYATVKVQFHWDREGKNDENTTIHLRAAQMSAGKGWGTLFIPRVGQEVIVQFLDGDPDRPVITGALYNETNQPPYPIPEHKTRSTIRTQSFEGGDDPGFNEIRFEDKKDAEQLYLHASKDHDTRVVHDQTNWVGNDRRHTVIHDQTETIHNDHTAIIGGNQTLKIGIGTDADKDDKDNDVGKVEEGGGQTITIKGQRTIEIGGTSTITIKDDATETLEKNLTTTITEARSLKAKTITLEADETITLKVGSTTLTISADGIALKTDKNISLTADGNVEAKSTGDTTLTATGNLAAKGTGGAKLESSANLEVKSGANLDIKAGANLTAQGTAQATFKGAIGELSASGPLTVKGAIVNIN